MNKSGFHSLLRWFWGAYLGCALLFSCSKSDPQPNQLIGTWKYNFWTLPNCANPDFTTSKIKPKDQIIITSDTFNSFHYSSTNKKISVTYPDKQIIYSYSITNVNGQTILYLSWLLDTGCTVNGNYSL